MDDAISGFADVYGAGRTRKESSKALMRTASGSERFLARMLKQRRSTATADLPWVKPVMTTPPTITTATTQPSGLTKVYAAGTSAALDTNFTVRGEIGRFSSGGGRGIYAVTWPSGGNMGSGRACTGVTIDTIADCDVISFHLSQALDVAFEVDGQFVSFTNTTTATNGTGPYDAWVTLTFATKAVRRIKLHFGAFADYFYGVAVKPTSSIWKPKPENEVKLQIIADSHSTGTGATFAGTSWPRVSAAAVGLDQWVASGIGGTGFVNPGTTWNYAAHLADITTFAPDVLMFCASVNDGGQANVTTTVTSTLTAARLLAPNALIIVTGVIAGRDSNHLGAENATKAGFDAWVDDNKLWLPCMTAAGGQHIFGTGRTGSLVGDGNADFYIGGSNGADVTHMPNDGHVYQAIRLAQELMAMTRSI